LEQRVDRKTREVAVAQYVWRYEAEFAAGFLRDANIAHRLQIDDPAMGISISTAATLWVLAADEKRAREILDISEEHSPRLSSRKKAYHHGSTRTTARIDIHDDGAQHTSTTHSKMTFRARSLAIICAVGIAGIGQVLLTNWYLPGPGPALAFLVAMLVVVGFTGRAPRALRNFLLAVSGGIP
tara:strand:+ start:2244 stop:2792 length:549 start_codon:yes stop_codon:yes gene_type:complete